MTLTPVIMRTLPARYVQDRLAVVTQTYHTLAAKSGGHEPAACDVQKVPEHIALLIERFGCQHVVI